MFTIHVVKTWVLMCCAGAAPLICAFVLHGQTSGFLVAQLILCSLTDIAW